MTAEEIIANERYHTCERCKYRDTHFEDYPCNECYCACKDHWEYRAESEDKE